MRIRYFKVRTFATAGCSVRSKSAFRSRYSCTTLYSRLQGALFLSLVNTGRCPSARSTTAGRRTDRVLLEDRPPAASPTRAGKSGQSVDSVWHKCVWRRPPGLERSRRICAAAGDLPPRDREKPPLLIIENPLFLIESTLFLHAALMLPRMAAEPGLDARSTGGPNELALSSA
jgi:hypothetical protein